ncbi:MAG: hypothetical protein GY765_11020 [bacterium]|nr:hypothetical protein [bacterium]
MKVTHKNAIQKYIDINVLSKAFCCFVSSKNKKERLALRFASVTSGGIMVESEKPIPDKKGKVYFLSYNLQFSFQTRLHPHEVENCFFIDFPKELLVDERRKFPRIFFESHENKIISLTSHKSKKKHQAILFNLSAGGIGFYLTDAADSVEEKETLYLDIRILGITINCFAVVRHVVGTLIGCQFISVQREFQAQMHRVIFKEIEWRSETYLAYLERKKKIVEKIKETEETKDLKKQESINYLDFINPFLESAISVVNSFLGITLKKKELRFEKISTGQYDASTFFDCESQNFKFQFFLCLREEVLFKMAKIVFDTEHNTLDDEVKDLLGELGNMIVGNAKTKLDSSHHYTLSTPGLILGKKHVLSTLSQFPAIRIMLESEIGDFDVILFVSDLIEKMKEKSTKEVDLCSAENLEFVEPIYNSCVNLFSNFLNLDIREKSITMRNPLVPKFEISAMLGISNQAMEGKMVLNLSRKLALKIYEILVNEKVDEFSEEVKDAVGEILNMITGNAKKEFQHKNIYYHLSTPFIVEGKEQVIKNVGQHPFLSSIYWTSEGFFELCYTLYNR